MHNTTGNKLNVLVTGSSGLIGSSLIAMLNANGYNTFRLKRHKQAHDPYWNLDEQKIDLNGNPDPDIIIHLAGENIAKSRWTTKTKQKIVKSRLQSTQLLVDFINSSQSPASLFICASAIGFYGNRGLQPVDENDPMGSDFVSTLAEKWENISQQINSPNTRVVNIRTGIVLSQNGGALAKMLPAFKLGLGGRIGSGKQIMSWIDLQDEISAILFIIKQHDLSGPINLVAPNAVDNNSFSITLAKILKRPCILPLPSSIVKLLFSQMGEELLLSSTHVRPTKLLKAGFKFEYNTLKESLEKNLL